MRPVQQGLPMAGRTQKSLHDAHQAAAFPLSPLLLQSQTEVPSGQASTEAPSRVASGTGGREGLGDKWSHFKGRFAGDTR